MRLFRGPGVPVRIRPAAFGMRRHGHVPRLYPRTSLSRKLYMYGGSLIIRLRMFEDTKAP